MGLKSRIELEKIISKFEPLRNRALDYMKNATELSYYGENTYAAALILKEIMSNPNSTAFHALMMADKAEVQYEELCEENKYRCVPEQSILFAFEMRKEALAMVRREIVDSLETHLGQKVIRMTNTQPSTLIERLQEYNAEGERILLESGFSKADIMTKVKTMEQLKDCFKPGCSMAELNKESKYFTAIQHQIQGQTFVQDYDNLEVTSCYTNIIEAMAMNNVAIEEIKGLVQELKFSAQKRAFKDRSAVGLISDNPRADHYFNIFEASLYGENAEANNANRKEIYSFAHSKFGVSELKALALLDSFNANTANKTKGADLKK